MSLTTVTKKPVKAKLGLVVVDFREHSTDTTEGYAVIEVPGAGGLRIRNCAVRWKGKERFLAFPFKAYEKNGKTEYDRHIVFATKEAKEAFEREALAAIDAFRASAEEQEAE